MEIKTFKEKSEFIENGFFEGYKVDVELTDYSIKTPVKFYTVTPYKDDVVPYFKVDDSKLNISDFRDKDINTKALLDSIQYEALKIVAVSDCPIKDWAKQTLSVTEQLWETIKGHEIGETIEYPLPNGDIISIIPCSDYANDDKIEGEIKDSLISFYLCDDEVVSSDESLTVIASHIVNYSEHELQLEMAKQDLQEFYDKKIYPIRNIPYKNRTEEQEENFGYFSDRYKELYGIRPVPKNNICYQTHIIYNDKNKTMLD